MTGPSDKAVEAAWRTYHDFEQILETLMEDALSAAHDPALGLDRSVCLRDVIEVLQKVERESAMNAHPHPDCIARIRTGIEREFGSN